MDKVGQTASPGSIQLSPEALAAAAAEAADTASAILLAPSEAEADPEAAAHQSPLPPSPPKIVRPAVPLARISSDAEPSNDVVVPVDSRGDLADAQFQFESRYVAPRHVDLRKARRASHLGYFRSQFDSGGSIRVPVDPDENDDDATVVRDPRSTSIYDAYMIQADIARNNNHFVRLQVVYSPRSKKYKLYRREGRVGLQGKGTVVCESAGLRGPTQSFCRVFVSRTGLSWKQRYSCSSPARYGSRWAFVELDYRKTPGSLEHQPPDYSIVDVNVNEEVKDVMELALYGGPARIRTNSHNASKTSIAFSSFTAPYEQLSSWTVFAAFKTLSAIWKHLESGRFIYWKTLLRASSRYRSQVPFCAELNRAPVICSYPALFLELKFLYALWPQQEIAKLLAECHDRASPQLSQYKTLVHPLYQAYASLRHGFRRLTDPSTLEFRELKAYLEKSCHPSHRLTLELQDIYRVFVKASLPNPYAEWVDSLKGVGEYTGEERLLLWHGTPLTSLLGILDLGLQIRRKGANFTGTMFGNGIYLTDVSSKSANYCRPEGQDNGDAVLLLCEADVGTMRIRADKSLYDGHVAIKRSKGVSRCVQGVGKITPAEWKKVEWDMGSPSSTDQGQVWMPDTNLPYRDTDIMSRTLRFNEYVIYDPSHVLIRYMFRLKIKHKR